MIDYSNLVLNGVYRCLGNKRYYVYVGFNSDTGDYLFIPLFYNSLVRHVCHAELQFFVFSDLSDRDFD